MLQEGLLGVFLFEAITMNATANYILQGAAEQKEKGR